MTNLNKDNISNTGDSVKPKLTAQEIFNANKLANFYHSSKLEGIDLGDDFLANALKIQNNTEIKT